jgi:hypothetical protein
MAMSTEHAHPRVPDIVLERLRLSELTPEEVKSLEAHLRSDEPLRLRLESLDRSDEEIRRIYPPEWLAARIRQRLDGKGRTSRRQRAAVYALATAAAAILLAVVLPRGGDRQAVRTGATDPTAQEERIKGLSPALVVYRRTGDGSELLADGAVARPGDLLRVAYRAAGRSYGVIVSIDGNGTLTRHLPPNGDRAAPLKRDTTVLLDSAYELDEAPRWERFYFVTGDAPFPIAPVEDAVRRAAADERRGAHAALALSNGLEQSTFALQKEDRP